MKRGKTLIQVVGLGAGSHARVIIEILQSDTRYKVIGMLDPKRDLHGSSILDVPILGGDEQLSMLRAHGVEHFFLGLGSTSDLMPRRRLYEFALSEGLKPVTVSHPNSVISSSAVLGMGTTVMAGAVINTGARLGDDVIVNTGAIVEHDCVLGNHVHIATGAKLCGGVSVGDHTHIGAGAVVRQCIQIGTSALIGMGAVVVKDVPDHRMVIGNPARLRERHRREPSR